MVRRGHAAAGAADGQLERVPGEHSDQDRERAAHDRRAPAEGDVQDGQDGAADRRDEEGEADDQQPIGDGDE